MTRASFSIMALIVCRNRREITLSAIKRLKQQVGNIQVTIAVFDDASIDGTPEAIADLHPDVLLKRGDGSAFWNGGLHQLWTEVSTAPTSAYLWLNDDTLLDGDALHRLTALWNVVSGDNECAIVVGATRDSQGKVSYAGYNVTPHPLAFRLSRVVPHATKPVPIATFNGNIVLVGRGVMSRIGLNDPGFLHNLGDVDYGLRARLAGIPVLLAPGTYGVCESNAAKRDYGYGSRLLSFKRQWSKVNTHHGLPFRSWWRFTRRHSGAWWLIHFILPYRHLMFFWRRGLAKPNR